MFVQRLFLFIIKKKTKSKNPCPYHSGYPLIRFMIDRSTIIASRELDRVKPTSKLGLTVANMV